MNGIPSLTTFPSENGNAFSIEVAGADGFSALFQIGAPPGDETASAFKEDTPIDDQDSAASLLKSLGLLFPEISVSGNGGVPPGSGDKEFKNRVFDFKGEKTPPDDDAPRLWGGEPTVVPSIMPPGDIPLKGKGAPIISRNKTRDAVAPMEIKVGQKIEAPMDGDGIPVPSAAPENKEVLPSQNPADAVPYLKTVASAIPSVSLLSIVAPAAAENGPDAPTIVKPATEGVSGFERNKNEDAAGKDVDVPPLASPPDASPAGREFRSTSSFAAAVEDFFPLKNSEKPAVLDDGAALPFSMSAAARAVSRNEESPAPSISLPVFDKGWVERMVRRIDVGVRDKKSEISVSLEPREFGHLRLSLTMEGDNVSVKFHVDNDQARQALETHWSDLRDSLRDKGWSLGGLSVNVGGQSFTDGRGFRETRGFSSSPYFNLMKDAPPPEAATWETRRVDMVA